MIIKLICYLNSNQKQVNPHFLSTVNKREKLGFFEKTVMVSYFPVSFSFLQQKNLKKPQTPLLLKTYIMDFYHSLYFESN